jgi:phosphoserine aminotransferase
VQKNVGPAGLAIVIIREDLIREDLDIVTPTMLKWKTQTDANSLYNTPNCFGIYMCGKVFKWLKKQGGLEEMKKRNEEKANYLYDYLDHSKYIAVADKDSRSIMNVTFKTNDPELDALFCEEAKKHGIISIKGHRAVGGMRASIYNAMTLEGVKALVEFMKEFEKEHL